MIVEIQEEDKMPNSAYEMLGSSHDGIDDFSNEDAAPDQYEPNFDEDDGIDEDEGVVEDE